MDGNSASDSGKTAPSRGAVSHLRQRGHIGSMSLTADCYSVSMLYDGLFHVQANLTFNVIAMVETSSSEDQVISK